MRISLGYQVFLAILIGIFCGIFFGPLCNFIKPVGDAYVMLLQMVALPYICFSLIHGLGSISPFVGKKLFLRGWPFWIFLWATIFIVIGIANYLIPKPESAFIGSVSAETNAPLSKNFLTYLVPQNPIYDLVNNIVPAIAVFSLIVGIAFMHIPNKEPMISLLERANQTIEKIFHWLAILSPIGIFAHIAVATGTVYFEDLYALEFYVVCFILITLFMTFWILPALLSSLTPLTYSEILSGFKYVCLLPFATAMPSIALPFINSYMKKLGQKQANIDSNFHATSQTVMPICYSFGQIGNCLILFFIMFLSFFYRHPFVGTETLMISILTVPLSLGSSATSINAVSFLIKQLRLPEGSIELFTQTLSVTLNFQVLLSVASVLTFVILVLYAYYGLLEIKWKRLFNHLVSAFAVLIFVVIGAKQVVHLRDNYQNLYMNLKIEGAIENPVASKIIKQGQEGTVRAFKREAIEPLETVLNSGVLKVGYFAESIPYSYFNNSQELAGYDIAYAYQLARDLDCILEFIPLDYNNMGLELSSGKYDIAMSAILMNENRIRDMDFTHPYTEQNNVLIVLNKVRSKFLNLETLMQTPSLRIGAIGGYVPVVSRHFPFAQLVEEGGLNPSLKKLFNSNKIDAFVWSRTSSFVWCLSNPEFTAIDYDGLLGKQYFSYPIASGAADWASFLNNWLILKEQSGFKEKMLRYWIEGESPRPRPPRWSLLQKLIHSAE